ncbi:hypothetical protein ACHHYP_01128 [Achlya hypogyna]|uniref:IPT/TIG domain-containing protein n=1 Tax=Achlya hypogyna TaxID=1202772 RepID=A0A1V9Z9H8_ACHHY|nr:hypothetical protein ACHHYP_01128 [Achlya hypogyna]
MGWEGATGHLYTTGTVHGNKATTCQRYHPVQGRKVKALYGNYDASLALVDGWEFSWMTAPAFELPRAIHDIKIHQLAFGAKHTIALSLDGHLYGWGSGEFGQLGLGGAILTAKAPRKLRELPCASFASIACGGYHSAAVTTTGALYTWGRNMEGQLGHASPLLSTAENEVKNGVFHHPKHVDDFLKKRCKQIACGDKFSVMLTDSGDVYACGEGQTGQLGQGRCTKQFLPMVTLLGDKTDGFVQVACGWAHALALTASGRLFAWGFNQYGQLGLDDTKSRFFPEEIPGLLFKHVYAGGNYSAGISSAGRLYTWGNGRYGKLGHGHENHVHRPLVVQAVQDTYVQSIACATSHMLFFAPSWVAQIVPTSGAVQGGTRLRIFGSGFWDSDELTVRFVPLTEGRLPRASLGSYDVTTGVISCEVPKFGVPGDFAVEVAMNGKHFTTNGIVFEVFVPPVFTHMSHKELPLINDAQVHVHLRGDRPKSIDAITVRWVPLSGRLDAVVVAGTCGDIPKMSSLSDDEENNSVVHIDDDEDDDVKMFMIAFPAPSFDSNQSELVACSLEISFNAVDFIPVRIIDPFAQGPPDPEIIYFHEAAVTRVVPNGIALPGENMTIEIRVQQMFDIGQLKCRIRFSELETPEAAYRVASANLTIHGYSVEDQVISCTIPPFADWRVDTIAPQKSDDDSDDDNTKHRQSASPPAIPRPWYQPETQWFSATVLVSLNGGATFLPPISPGVADVVAYTPGQLQALVPPSGPLSGGTLVMLSANYLHFDTNDAMVSIEYNGDIQFVPGFVKAPSEATVRVLTFEMPSFFVAPPAPTESPRPGAPPIYPPTPVLPPAVIKIALNGKTYHQSSSLPFEFYCKRRL